MNTLKLSSALGAYCLLIIGACAHSNPPKELIDARAAYQRAASGLAQSENPAQLHTAEKSLAMAEQQFEEDGDSLRTRDFSYIAMRKAQLAEVQARISQNEKKLAAMEEHMTEAQRAELSQLRGAYASQQQQLANEQQARQAAEHRAELAAADLARIATVKQEARGMVITLSGQVLFASGKSELLPSARTKLTEVASALTVGNPNATIVVEGHTDSQGSKSFNLDLSQRRAQAVRDFLASHGVASDRIRAEGMGFTRPVADNKTAEGRANNRRVEIVVQPAAGQTAPGQQG
jgi:outer membrane protein OmpA-like peptidoglycan-associated protein